MVARARKSNESFGKYRKNLIKEAVQLKFRLSPAWRDGKTFNFFVRHLRRVVKSAYDRRGHHALPKKQSRGIRYRGADGIHRGGIDGTKL